MGSQSPPRPTTARRARRQPRRARSRRPRADRPRDRPPRPLHAARRAATARHRLRVRPGFHRPLPVRPRPLRRRDGDGTCSRCAAGLVPSSSAAPTRCWRRCPGSRRRRRPGRASWRRDSATPCATAPSPSTPRRSTTFGGDVPALLGQVVATPGMPARRLGEFLGNWSRFGAVDVPTWPGRRTRRVADPRAQRHRGPHGDLSPPDLARTDPTCAIRSDPARSSSFEQLPD